MAVQGAAQTDRVHKLKVLVSAASMHGATGGIAQAIGEVLSERGFATTAIPPEEVNDVEGYDAVIIGSAVYAGHWLVPAKDLVNGSRDALASPPGVAVFQRSGRGSFGQAVPGDEERSRRRSRNVRGDPRTGSFHVRWEARPEGFESPPARLAPGVPRPGGDFRDWAEIRQRAGTIAQQLALVRR